MQPRTTQAIISLSAGASFHSRSRSARQSRETSEERMEAKHGYSPLAGDDHEAAAEVIRATSAGFEGDDVKLRLLGYKQQLKRDLS